MDENEGYLGDLSKTRAIWDLCRVDPPRRDDAWRASFLANVAGASFRCGDPQVIEGPDGYPYFQLLLPEPETAFQCYVLERMKDDFLLEHGLGVAINPDRGVPDWVFSYGDVLCYHLYGEFYSQVARAHDPPECEAVTGDEEVIVGQPSEEFLPAATRRVIRAHLESMAVEDPKILLMARRDRGGVTDELVFDISPDRFPTEELYRTVMLSLGWFLPRHYTYVSLRGTDLDDGFVSL